MHLEMMLEMKEKRFFLNRMKGISYKPNDKKRNTNVSDHGGIYQIHDKNNDWEITGRANAEFFYEDRKTMSHGTIPRKSLVIGWVRIDDEYRGKGFGSKLIAYVEEEGRKKGMKHSYAVSVMAEAKNFWTKMGYKWSGDERIWIKKL